MHFVHYYDTISKLPYVNMYAIWDSYPQIFASDIYYGLDAVDDLTEEYLLSLAYATDEELINVTDAEGKMKNKEDTTNNTTFSLYNFSQEHIKALANAYKGDFAMSITYQAVDSVGNVTRKLIMLHIVDSSAKESILGQTRFISEEYLYTLDEDSIWNTNEEYKAVLADALSYKRINVEYTKVPLILQLLGLKSVEIPGSGEWNKKPDYEWSFTNEQELEMHDYIKTHGFGNTKSSTGLTDFYNKFLAN